MKSIKKRKELFIGVSILLASGLLAWQFRAQWLGFFIPILGLFCYLIYLAKLFSNRHRIVKQRQKQHRDQLITQIQALNDIDKNINFKGYIPPMVSGRAAPDFLSVLVHRIIQKEPKLIVECGSGVSSLIIGSLLRDRDMETRFISLEHDEAWAEVHRQDVRDHRLEENIESWLRPLKEYEIDGKRFLWYAWEEEELRDIDMVVVDGPPGSLQHQSRYPALPLLREQLAPGAVFILDDADRDDERAIIKQWQQQYDCRKTRYWPTVKGTAEITFE